MSEEYYDKEYYDELDAKRRAEEKKFRRSERLYAIFEYSVIGVPILVFCLFLLSLYIGSGGKKVDLAAIAAGEKREIKDRYTTPENMTSVETYEVADYSLGEVNDGSAHYNVCYKDKDGTSKYIVMPTSKIEDSDDGTARIEIRHYKHEEYEWEKTVFVKP